MSFTSAELDPTMKCIKYLLVAFNLIFVLTGVLIISVGITIRAIYHDFSSFLEASYFSPAGLMIAIGLLILFVALFGCLGAAKESTCMIMVFSLFLGIIFILEISAGIAGYALGGKIDKTINDKMVNVMHNYADPEMAAAIDMVQNVFDCCGMKGREDWDTIITKPTDNTINATIGNDTIILPDSCCRQPDLNNLVCMDDRTDGCHFRLSLLIRQSAALLGGAAITVSIIQIIGIYFSVTLAKAIRYAKTERERRRQEIREQLMNSYSLMNAEKQAATVYLSEGTNTDSTA